MGVKPVLSGSLFHEDWWLDAASGGDWAQATVQLNGKVFARLPYVVKRMAGMVGLGMPPLTRTLGPQFFCNRSGGSPPDYRRISAELIAQLPKHDYFTQILDPAYSQALPFYASGFESTLSYTIRIPPGQTPAMLRSAQRKQLRYDIKRAQQEFSIDSEIDMDEFCNHHNRWLRTNHNVWWSGSYERRADNVKLRLFEACRAQSCIQILGARDGQSALRAAIVLVWGHGVMYYWLSSRDPDPAANGAAKLLISHAVELAADKGLWFDFDGFPRPSAVSMISGFGGEITNRITVSKFSVSARLARAIGARLKIGI